jgi:hypothetical protein
MVLFSDLPTNLGNRSSRFPLSHRHDYDGIIPKTSRLRDTHSEGKVTSPLAFSTYPNIDQFTEHGQIVIGYMEPVGAVAIAAEGRQTIAMLRRRKEETFKQLLARLDLAIANATIDEVYVDEVNAPQI